MRNIQDQAQEQHSWRVTVRKAKERQRPGPLSRAEHRALDFILSVMRSFGGFEARESSGLICVKMRKPTLAALWGVDSRRAGMDAPRGETS